LKTLERSYLMRKNDKVVERPSYMMMRVAIALHKPDMDAILQCYNSLSTRKYTHATPTLFNAGTKTQQLASCFLENMEDSIEGIFKTHTDSALISKRCGGIGMSLSKIRSKGSRIHGTDGISDGIVPLMRMLNASARYINQGGRRPGSVACYLEPWHADVLDFLEIRNNSGNEHARARDLFTALWIPDLFMKRVKSDSMWSLFCPADIPDLIQLHSEDFEIRYQEYEISGIARKTVRARDIWNAIMTAIIETGTPYICFKDAVNRKTNQSNLGTIQCSNLCSEIMQYTSEEETAVCNLASINVAAFVEENKVYDFQELHKISAEVCVNLNRVIDISFYPVPEAKHSNTRNRPIGIGQQGLANVFFKMGLAFDSPEAHQLSKRISEVIQHGALTASMELAKEQGSYQTYVNSPISKGLFQHNLWGVQDSELTLNWDELRQDILKYGVRNSLVTTIMPTASTAQILGNIEGCEAQTSNLYLRRTMSGEFVVINKYLAEYLLENNQWTPENVNQLLLDEGSVKNLNIPQEIKDIYKTVFEIRQKVIIDQARDRGSFICQSQSMNLFVEQPSISVVTSMLFYSWSQGLKTGQYYLRTKPKASAIKFVVQDKKEVCRRNDPDCLSCGA
jgi:ribonucleoside-diphosphate reductase alpha subunit